MKAWNLNPSYLAMSKWRWLQFLKCYTAIIIGFTSSNNERSKYAASKAQRKTIPSFLYRFGHSFCTTKLIGYIETAKRPSRASCT